MVVNDRDTKTYILSTIKNEFYCGKTVNITRRLDEHRSKKGVVWNESKT